MNPTLWEMEYFLPYQKTGMTQSSATPALQCELVSPKGTQEGEEYLWSSNNQMAATPYGKPKGAQEVKHTGYWPR